MKFVPPKRTSKSSSKPARSPKPKRRSSLLDTRVIFCGDNLDKLKDFPDASVDLIYIDPPFNTNRNNEIFWGETREKISCAASEARYNRERRRVFRRRECCGCSGLSPQP